MLEDIAKINEIKTNKSRPKSMRKAHLTSVVPSCQPFSFLNSEVVAERPKVPRKVVDELPEIEEDATPEVEEEELLSYID